MTGPGKDKFIPPNDYEDLIRLIHDRFEGMSKTYQRIVLFLAQTPNDVAVNSGNATVNFVVSTRRASSASHNSLNHLPRETFVVEASHAANCECLSTGILRRIAESMEFADGGNRAGHADRHAAATSA